MRLARLLTLSGLAFATPTLAAPPSKPAMTKPTETKAPAAPAPSSLEAETQAWHQKRVANLSSEDGWLTLVGLHWFEEGEHRFGSAEDNALVFPPGTPARIGTLTRKGPVTTVAIEPGVTLTRNGKPFTGGPLGTSEKDEDVLTLGTVRFYLIQRGEKFALRVKNPEAPARKQFHGIPTWPVSAAWRIEGRFEPSTTPRKLSVPTVYGTVEEMNSPGTLVFQVNGQEYRLSPVRDSETEPFFVIFGDQTNRNDSYGAGRFLTVEPPKDGRVVLDFNRAYNPPCAFSPFATCPLPPASNRLSLRVEAGEKRYGDH